MISSKAKVRRLRKENQLVLLSKATSVCDMAVIAVVKHEELFSFLSPAQARGPSPSWENIFTCQWNIRIEPSNSPPPHPPAGWGWVELNCLSVLQKTHISNTASLQHVNPHNPHPPILYLTLSSFTKTSVHTGVCSISASYFRLKPHDVYTDLSLTFIPGLWWCTYVWYSKSNCLGQWIIPGPVQLTDWNLRVKEHLCSTSVCLMSLQLTARLQIGRSKWELELVFSCITDDTLHELCIRRLTCFRFSLDLLRVH